MSHHPSDDWQIHVASGVPAPRPQGGISILTHLLLCAAVATCPFWLAVVVGLLGRFGILF